MDLCIRSQDRERLLKCNFIGIRGNLINKIDSISFEGYDIVVYFDNNIGYETLGTYKSKERALEVLDEIQAILSPKLKTMFTKDGLNVEVIDKNYDVYQMPEN